MANDLFTALRTYLSKVSSGDKSPQELATALNQWAKESGEAIKVRIEEEVEKTVKRMGFAKKSDLDRLERDIQDLKKKIYGTAKAKPSSGNKATAKVTGKSGKKTAAKKVTKSSKGQAK